MKLPVVTGPETVRTGIGTLTYLVSELCSEPPHSSPPGSIITITYYCHSSLMVRAKPEEVRAPP